MYFVSNSYLLISERKALADLQEKRGSLRIWNGTRDHTAHNHLTAASSASLVRNSKQILENDMYTQHTDTDWPE